MTTGISGRFAEKQNQEKEERELALKRHQQRIDIEFLLDIPQFHRYMKNVLASGRIMQSCFTGNSQTFYNEGRRDYSTEIWASIAEIDNKAAVEMLLPENKEEEQHD